LKGKQGAARVEDGAVAVMVGLGQGVADGWHNASLCLSSVCSIYHDATSS
jgi:hypothetical protein